VRTKHGIPTWQGRAGSLEKAWTVWRDQIDGESEVVEASKAQTEERCSEFVRGQYSDSVEFSESSQSTCRPCLVCLSTWQALIYGRRQGRLQPEAPGWQAMPITVGRLRTFHEPFCIWTTSTGALRS